MNTTLSLLDAALQYAANGWAVFPCAARGKQPIISRGCRAATTDQQLIATWWQRWPDANIGIATGPISGVCVLDLDNKHHECDGLGWWADQRAEHGEVVTLTSQTGSGGQHLFFTHDDRVRNSSSKLAPGVDTRGDGGYIIAPPSIHDTGMPYEWIVEAPIVPVPVWLLAIIEEIAKGKRNGHKGNLVGIHRSPEPIDFDLTMRVSEYLAKCEPAISGQHGHDRTIAVVGIVVRGFGLSHDDAYAMLQPWNCRCDPPWSERELRHKIDDALRTPDPGGRAPGWLRDAERVDSVTIDPVDPVPAEAVEPVPESPSKLVIPAELWQGPGIVGQIANWITATAVRPQPILSLATAFAFAGAVLGRKVATETNLRTNLYCIGVAESGAGKDHSRQCIKTLCHTAACAQILGGEDVTSDSAIMSRLANSLEPNVLFLLDEIGHFLCNAGRYNASGATRSVPVILTKLFSSAGGLMLGKEYANPKINPRQDILQPNVCLYGTTVPNRLARGITPEEIQDGFFGRILVWQAHDQSPEPAKLAGHLPPPEAVVDWVTRWQALDTKPKKGGNLNRVMGNEPLVLAYKPDANAIMEAFAASCRTRQLAMIAADEMASPIWSRAAEHAAKLALISAAARDLPCIDSQSVAYACSLAEALIESLIEWSASHVATTERQRHFNEILRYIRMHRRNGVTKRDILRRFQQLDARERDSILADIVYAEYVTIAKRGKAAYLVPVPSNQLS